jgi:hypothetical protein
MTRLARRAPSPRRGEGWGEGVRKFQKISAASEPPHPRSLRSLDLSPPGRGEEKRVSLDSIQNHRALAAQLPNRRRTGRAGACLHGNRTVSSSRITALWPTQGGGACLMRLRMGAAAGRSTGNAAAAMSALQQVGICGLRNRDSPNPADACKGTRRSAAWRSPREGGSTRAESRPGRAVIRAERDRALR